MSSLYAGAVRVAFVVYVVAVLVVVFQPQPELATGSVDWVGEWLRWLRLPEAWAGHGAVELGLNVVLFVPVAALGSLAFPQVRWSEWVVICFVGSGLIEITQGVFLEGRSATFSDVVANTLGGLVGAVIALGFSRSRR